MPTRPSAPRRRTLLPRPRPRTPVDAELHLLRRATYGPTPATLAQVRSLGLGAWIEQQLAPASIPDPVGNLITAKYPRLQWTVPQVRAAMPNGHWDVMFELGQATIARGAWSTRQLFEVMVDFWSNHLNVTNPSSEVWDNRHLYDRDVIRRHALGRFSDMLVASASHPAMLRYLDNASSTKDAPNENYGRELLELHTVGVAAGYTEAMMVDSARIMTGFTVDDAGLFRYDPSVHWTGPVSVLGFTHPNSAADGQAVGVAYLRHLATHPSTAHRIATKLVQRFVSDVPSPELVSRLAKIYLASGTAIVPVLRTLLGSSDFYAAHGTKLRRPYEDLLATIRTLGIAPLPATSTTWTKGLESLYWMVDGMGMPPMGWHPPNGYPDVAPAWQSASGTLARWNSHVALAAQWWPDKTELTHPTPRSWLPATLPPTYGALVDALARRLVFTTLPPARRDAVLGFMGKQATDPVAAGDEWVDWRLPYVAALVLDSPSHGMR